MAGIIPDRQTMETIRDFFPFICLIVTIYAIINLYTAQIEMLKQNVKDQKELNKAWQDIHDYSNAAIKYAPSTNDRSSGNMPNDTISHNYRGGGYQ